MPARRLATVAVALAALAAPGAAHAGLPSTSADIIKLGRAIGAVDLGESVNAAKLGWGRSAATCSGDSVNGLCRYEERTPNRGWALFYVNGRKASSVSIGLGPVGGTYVLRPPLVEFRTAKGIGLGSTVASLRKAYPRAKRSATTYSLAGPGRAYTTFATDGKRVISIEVGDGLHQA